MVRKATLTLLTLMAVVAGLIILPRTAAAISLKENSVVTGDTITLGDVFTGLPENHEKVLGLAPQPGKDMTLNARTLLRIAIALDLPWRPSSNADHVTLSRAATIVSNDMLEEALRTELANEGVTGKYNIAMTDKDKQIILPPDVGPGVEITNFDYKPESGWFEAETVAPSLDNPVSRSRITGNVHKIIDVPVLRTSVKAGDIINGHDIDMIEMKESEIANGTILDAAELDGLTPRHMVMTGKPLKSVDFEEPQMIARGEIVTMTFEFNGLHLTATGKALENGAKGDVIRILNQTSNKTVEGFVTASKEVTIKSF